MFHSVIIATKGRPSVLQETLISLAAQDCPPDEIIISATENRDVEDMVEAGNIQVLQGAAGSCTQRNTGIRALNPECGLVTFLDDDVELAPDYCRLLRRFLEKNTGVEGVGGLLLLNGATRPEAKEAIKQRPQHSAEMAQDTPSLYGCNMSFRRRAIRDEWFDEKLSLYAWLEDFDFSTRVARKGRLMLVPEMGLCHLRSPSGHMSHARFGFAQIMNPWYLAKKGIINRKELWKIHVLGAVAGNLCNLPTDARNRSQRLRGNLRALALIACGKIQPEAVKHIDM